MNKHQTYERPLRIIGSGHYLPECIVTNEMLAGIVDTSDEWIRTRTGISERHMTTGEPTWQMGKQAACRALAAAGLQGSQIDLILCTTVTPDYLTPSLACIIQAEIEAPQAFTMDIGAACTGFIYALDVASRYLLDDRIENILIVSAESLSKIVDFTHRSTCVLFGDGAGAVVVRRGKASEPSRLLATHLGSDGAGGGALVVRGMRDGHPFMDSALTWPDRFGEREGCYITMNGPDVFRFAVHAMTDATREVLRQTGTDISEIRYLIPHQANTRIVDAAAKRLGAEPSQIIDRLASLGNTSSATIPICLDQLIREAAVERGDRLVLTGFGAGLTYGSALLVY